MFIWPKCCSLTCFSFLCKTKKNGNDGKGRAVKDEGRKSPENVLETHPSGFGLICTFLMTFLFDEESGQLFSSNSAFDTEGNE